jgi:hypothetical protein
MATCSDPKTCRTDCLFSGVPCGEYTHVYNGDAASYGVILAGRAGSARRVKIVATLVGEGSIPVGATVRVTGSRVVTRGRWAVAS